MDASDTPPPKRPFITANQVTLLRLLLMPLPCWWMYGSHSAQYAALVVATILGCTDFVDGYLARKYGVTVLGSLMDPIADKVFIAIAFLPAVDLHWVPRWMVTALLVREFLVTAARTVYERRAQQLKSTYLARFKTWLQMCGIGVIMLLAVAPPLAFQIVCGIAAVAPLLALLVRWLLVKKVWRSAIWFAISFGALFVTHWFTDGKTTSMVLMTSIVGITWLSGLGYLMSVGELRGKGRIRPSEVVRLVAAVALPILAVEAQAADVAPKWAVIALVSFEMAHGGLDNLLAHHRVESGAWSWGGRSLFECAGLLLAIGGLWMPLVGLPVPAPWLLMSGGVAAAALAALALTTAFIQKRKYYLDPKMERLTRTPPPVAQLVSR